MLLVRRQEGRRRPNSSEAAQFAATKAKATERLSSPISTVAVTMAEADPSYHKSGEGRYGYIAAGGYPACPAT
jgi:hypothetical protein